MAQVMEKPLSINTYISAKEKRVTPLPVEPYDKEWGVGLSGNTPDPSPFPRINRILKVTPRTTNGEVNAQRALLVTEAYQAHESDPQIIKCAYAMYNHFSNSPIEIYPDELIVGTLGCPKKAGPVFPEYGVDWVVDEMKNGLMNYSEVRTHDYFWYDDSCIEKLESIQPYWRGQIRCRRRHGPPYRRRTERFPCREKGVFQYQLCYFRSGPSWDKL